MKKDKGFSLIELAIVLILIGMLVGLGAGLVGMLMKRVKYSESKEAVNAFVQSILGFADSSGRLPTLAELPSVVRSTKDSYGREIAYIYDASLATSSTYGLCGLTSTKLSVIVCSDALCSTNSTISNVAFVAVSGDGNYNNQTSNSTAVSSPTTLLVYEYGVNNIDNYPGDINRPEPYDDIVKWVVLGEIQSSQDCEPLTIKSPPTLPMGTEDTSYFYQLQASGGRPPYTWSGSPGGGLSLANDGTISGVINIGAGSTGELNACSGTIGPFSATVQDSAGQSVSNNFTIPVKAQDVQIITGSLPDAYEGSSYTATISATGGSGSYTFSVVSGSLPNGLNLNSSTGLISGTPTTDSGCSEYVANFSVRASANGCTGYSQVKGFSINVKDPDCGGGGGGCTLPSRFRIVNRTGWTLYYRVNSGICRSWSNNTSITVNTSDSVEVFISNSCSSIWRIYVYVANTCTGVCPDSQCTIFGGCSTQSCVLAVKDSDGDGNLEIIYPSTLLFRMRDR